MPVGCISLPTISPSCTLSVNRVSSGMELAPELEGVLESIGLSFVLVVFLMIVSMISLESC